MKNLDRKVTLLCPLCGNDQFESLGNIATVHMGLTFMILHSVLVAAV